jgi:hypothetical protein
MKCREIPEEAVIERIATLQAIPRHASASDAANLVHFELDVDPEKARGGTFVIRSQRTGEVVYLGPYAPRVQIAANPSLQDDGGWDNLTFELLLPRPGLSCRWSTDLGHPFWTEAQRVRIKLMAPRHIDDQGLVHDYDVEILR